MAQTKQIIKKETLLTALGFIGQTLLALAVFASLYFLLIAGFALGFDM